MHPSFQNAMPVRTPSESERYRKFFEKFGKEPFLFLPSQGV